MCRNSRCGTPAKVSCNANSLVADENTPDVMLWFIKAYDYNQKRVLNVSFCTRYMGPPFFFRAIPTYGVLPYSMMYYCDRSNSCPYTYHNPPRPLLVIAGSYDQDQGGMGAFQEWPQVCVCVWGRMNE